MFCKQKRSIEKVIKRVLEKKDIERKKHIKREREREIVREKDRYLRKRKHEKSEKIQRKCSNIF